MIFLLFVMMPVNCAHYHTNVHKRCCLCTTKRFQSVVVSIERVRQVFFLISVFILEESSFKPEVSLLTELRAVLTNVVKAAVTKAY